MCGITIVLCLGTDDFNKSIAPPF
uniref:Uncharacterized protein n=1 Tax=Rhizophora mucronata TaxID=61149 RepID=A0A2P2QR02_RHIMU